jgi:phthiodiolone/phenolphthiodiolone dimycocerosates ketoreductase
VVPESLLRETILAGTSDEILDQLAEWRHHGLGYGVFTDISMAGPSLRRGLAAGLPFARILRGARRL